MKGRLLCAVLFVLLFKTDLTAKGTKKISNNEISVSATASYGFTYDKLAPTYQIQYFRLVNPAKFISTGFAYEGMLADSYRHTFLIPIEFWINPSLALVVSPGFTFNEDLPTSFTTHVEARYVFHLGFLRLGPKAKFAFNQYENFFSVGVYAGVPF